MKRRNYSKIQTADDPFNYIIVYKLILRVCTEGVTHLNHEERWRKRHELGLMFMLKGHCRWQVPEVP